MRKVFARKLSAAGTQYVPDYLKITCGYNEENSRKGSTRRRKIDHIGSSETAADKNGRFAGRLLIMRTAERFSYG